MLVEFSFIECEQLQDGESLIILFIIVELEFGV